MRKRNHKRIAERKAKIRKRLERKKGLEIGDEPMMQGGNVHYEMSGRARSIACGGIGAIHTMVRRLGLPKAIDDALALLKIHAPYFESDHVLNIAYNVLTGGTCLEDIERLRNDETYLDALGARKIPDPTTAGDFLRRFNQEALEAFMDVVNGIREMVWDSMASRDKNFYNEAILEVDGTIAATLGECKGGMDISYKGIWGYAPLIVTLANTGEVLYIVNRPGNTPSCVDAARWIDKAIELVSRKFKKVLVRGDTDFSQTEYLDGWKDKVTFEFGYDACPNLVDIAEARSQSGWDRLERKPKYTVETQERARPENVKERIVKEREYKNLRLLSEDVAEFDYRPGACKSSYRMVVVRKNISVEKGENVLFPETRYFFYITNNRRAAKEEIVFSVNKRCDQENIIAQLKGGIGALRPVSDSLESNWAYMVIASLAWTFKAWYAMYIPDPKQSRRVLRMEFKRFFHSFVNVPCQIVKSGRRLIYRVTGFNYDLETFFKTFDAIRALRCNT